MSVFGPTLQHCMMHYDVVVNVVKSINWQLHFLILVNLQTQLCTETEFVMADFVLVKVPCDNFGDVPIVATKLQEIKVGLSKLEALWINNNIGTNIQKTNFFHSPSIIMQHREGALFTFTMAMTAILRGNLYYVYGHLPLKMATIVMVKVNNAHPLYCLSACLRRPLTSL